jgi:hypothetical protein
MKVKCIRYFDSRRRPASESVWLTKDKVYEVLGMREGVDQKLDYLIVVNERDPMPTSLGFHPSESFEVINDTRPSNWEESFSKGVMRVLPRAWLEPGFFEKLYDGDPDAYSIFERERKLIVGIDP